MSNFSSLGTKSLGVVAVELERLFLFKVFIPKGKESTCINLSLYKQTQTLFSSSHKINSEGGGEFL